MRENLSADIVSKYQLSAPIHPPLWRMGYSPVVQAPIDESFRQRGKQADGSNPEQFRVSSAVNSLMSITGIKFLERFRGNWGFIQDQPKFWILASASASSAPDEALGHLKRDHYGWAWIKSERCPSGTHLMTIYPNMKHASALAENGIYLW